MSRRPSMSFQSLSHLDNYIEGDLIGQGSFGIIHKVTRKSDGQVLARKQLNFSKMTTRDKQQLVAEVNILNKLNHPHIVGYTERILDPDRGIIYLIMEYCGGGDLSHLIRECERTGRQIPEDTIWDYFCQIVQALVHCHAPGSAEDGVTEAVPSGRRTPSGKEREKVLHRDLKPDNVFLDDSRENVKLGDFGLSKSMGSAAFANTYVGTPYYMSPELFNESAYDAKSDIWALGCVIYEMVALHPPFHLAKTHNDLANQLRSQRIPPLPRKVSPALRDVIMRMLSFDPKGRPSALDLLSHPMMEVHKKMQDMHKSRHLLNHRAIQLNERETSLAAREQAVVEREERCASQERKISSLRRGLEAEREQLKAEKLRWDEERRASPPAGNGSAGSSSSERMEMEGVQEITPARMMGSRVPRRSFARPLEEKKSPTLSIPTSTLASRSRDSCVFDLNTPTKSNFGGLQPSSAARRLGTPSRMASKSMGNLAAAATADRLREEENRLDVERRKEPGRASVGSPNEAKTLGRVAGTGGGGGGGVPRRASPAMENYPPRSTSSNSHYTNPFGGPADASSSSSSKPSSSRPPLPTSMHSMPTQPHTYPHSAGPTTTSFPDKPLYPNTPARYDPNDTENLPSPFLRKVVDISSTLQPPGSGNGGTRPSMPRSRSTAGISRESSSSDRTTAGGGGGGGSNLARMAMAGNAAANQTSAAMEKASSASSSSAGMRAEGYSRPSAMQRVSRINSMMPERPSSRESIARAEAAMGEAQRALLM